VVSCKEKLYGRVCKKCTCRQVKYCMTTPLWWLCVTLFYKQYVQPLKINVFLARGGPAIEPCATFLFRYCSLSHIIQVLIAAWAGQKKRERKSMLLFFRGMQA
jgi:hypothetical protein